MSFPQRVAENILPRSNAQNLPAAFREWHFTGYTCDHGEAEETCQMCEKEQLRYHFEIKNRLTGHALMVGSTCILRFDVPVFDGDRELSKKEAAKHLNDHMQRMRREACVKALKAVAASERNDILSNAIRYYESHDGKLSPKLAAVVFWRLKANRIDHHPSFFKVSLARDQHKMDLKNMDRRGVLHIWPALTPAQRRIAVELGHAEPTWRSSDDEKIADIKRRVEQARPGRLKLPKPE